MNESSELSEDTIELAAKQDPQAFRLPKIERLPSSHPPKQVRSTTRLPTLRNDPSLDRLQAASERRLPDPDSLVITVERRVRQVREEQNIAEEAESEDSSDDHFVRKIKENKEIIKQTKRRNQQARKENQANNYIGNFQKRGSAKVEGRAEGRAEGEGVRRQSQRRQREVSRRAVGKESAPHKDSTALKEAPSNREIAVREFRSRDELTPLNKILPSPLALREPE